VNLTSTLDKQIEEMVNVEVKINPLAVQSFENTVEDCLAKVFFYEDELVQTIGLSLIPEPI